MAYRGGLERVSTLLWGVSRTLCKSRATIGYVDGRFGALFPSRRASDKPIAIACFGSFTFLPDLPL